MSAEHKSQFSDFTDDGDVFMWVNNSRMGQKTANIEKFV